MEATKVTTLVCYPKERVIHIEDEKLAKFVEELDRRGIRFQYPSTDPWAIENAAETISGVKELQCSSYHEHSAHIWRFSPANGNVKKSCPGRKKALT